MNLLQQRKTVNFFEDINPISFRSYQYNFLLDFLENAINFVSQQKGDYLEVTHKKMHERLNYTGVYNSKLTKIELYAKNLNNNVEKLFSEFHIPTLIDNNHFYLNGCYYTPGLYLVDHPITVKKKSIMISSLFNSITIYNKDDIVIFTGRNFRLDGFLQLFVDFDDEIYQEYLVSNKLNHDVWDKEELIEFYSKKFTVEKDLDKIKEKMEKLFFDDYTRELYKMCYGFEEVRLEDIVLLSLKKSLYGENLFNDLNNKRLVFIEFLLKSYLTKISHLATEVAKGITKDNMLVDDLIVKKFFLASEDTKSPSGKMRLGLNGNYIYDSKNLYSGILKPKCTFITPGMSVAPKEVKHLHPSHYGRVCPITISSQEPGKTVSLIPDLKLNEFGIFI